MPPSVVMNRAVKRALQNEYRRQTQKRNGTRPTAKAAQSGGNAAVSVAGQLYAGSGISAPPGASIAVRNIGRIANAIYVPDNVSTAIYSVGGASGSSGGGGGGGPTYTEGDGINIVATVISVDSADIADGTRGISAVGNNLGVNLATNPGLEFDGTGKLKVKPYHGLELSANGLGIKLGTTPALAVDASGLIVKLDTNPGLVKNAGGLVLGTPSTLAHNSSNAVSGANHSHAITASSDVGTTPVASLLKSDAAGALVLSQLTLKGNLVFAAADRFITASDDLTISPDDDLWLDPGGLIMLPNAQEIKTSTFNDFVSNITGTRIWDTGGNLHQLSISKIKADELHVRVFSADEQRVSRGAEFWSYGFGIVETEFQVPADEATVDVWFEEAPDLGSFKLFRADDWIQFRTIDVTTGLIVQTVWFQVVDGDAAGLNDWVQRQNASDLTPSHVSRQQWRLRRKSGGFMGEWVRKGNVAVDFGKPFSVTTPSPGQGVVHLSALDFDGGPFVQIQTFESVSADVPQFKNRVRMGNLDGLVDYSLVADPSYLGMAWGFAAGDDLSVVPDAGFSGLTADSVKGLRLFNTALEMYQGGDLVLTLNPTAGLTLLQDTDFGDNDYAALAWKDVMAGGTVKALISAHEAGTPDYSYLQMQALNPGASKKSAVNIAAIADTGVAVIALVAGESIDYISLASDEIHLGNRVMAGTAGGNPVADLHVKSNNASINETVGMTIEQAGAGDAVLHWRLTTPDRYYTMGIDNSTADDVWKLSASTSLGTSDFIVVNPGTGQVTITGLVGGSGGGGTPPVYTGEDGIDIVGGEISVDSSVVRTGRFVNTTNGLQGGGNLSADLTLSILLAGSSGMIADGSGLRLNPTVAGAGLLMTSGIIDAVALSTGGLQVNANDIEVKLPAPSGLTKDSTGLSVASGLAGNGLLMTAKVLDVVPGNGLSVSADAVLVNQGYAFVWTASHTFNADIQLAANLDFTGGVDRSITATNSLFITPGSNLVLDPAGNIMMPNAQVYRSTTVTDAPTGIRGINIFNRPDFHSDYVQMTIGAIKADELSVRVFSADEVRISRGEQQWSRSFGIVEEDFTQPAVGEIVDVWFEDAPALGGANLFIAETVLDTYNGSWLRSQTVDMVTGLVVQAIWWRVGAKIADADATEGPPPHDSRQQWRIKRIAGGSATVGLKIKKGVVFVDYGDVGQGVVHLSALQNTNGPFIQVGKFTGVSTTPTFEYKARFGNLKGAAGYATEVYGIAAGNDLSIDPASGGFSGFTLEDQNGLRLYNTEIQMYNDDGDLVVNFNQLRGLAFLNDTDELGSGERYLSWYEDFDLPAIGQIGSFGAGFNAKTMLVLESAKGASKVANVILRASQDTPARQGEISVGSGSTTFAHTYAYIATERTAIRSLYTIIGDQVELDAANATAHVYANTTGIDEHTGLLIEQAGSGDSMIHWLKSEGTDVYYSMGIDNSDSDKWKLSAASSLGTSDLIVVGPGADTAFGGDIVTLPTTRRFAIGTLTPGTDLVGTFDHTSPQIHIYGDGYPTFVARGTVGAAIDLVADNSSGGSKWLRILNDGGSERTRFMAMSDAGVVAADILTLQHWNGFVGINNVTPNAQLDLVTEGAFQSIRATLHADNVDAYTFVGRRANGTVVEDTEPVLNTEMILGIAGYAYTSGGWPAIPSGYITLRAQEDQSLTGFPHLGAEWRFHTRGIGVDGERSRLVLGSQGVTIGLTDAGDSTALFTVTSGATYTMGIDLTDGYFKVSRGGVLGASGQDLMWFDETDDTWYFIGAAMVSGGGGESLHVPATGGDGIDITGAQTINVDTTVVRTSRTISTGNGLSGGGDLSGDLLLHVDLATDSGLTLVGFQLGVASSIAGDGLDYAAGVLEVDSSVVRGSLTLFAGAGLTGGGDLDVNRTFNVGAGSGITVNADDVAINLAVSSGLNLTSGLAIDAGLAGAGLTLTAGVLDVVALSTGGLTANANDLQIKLPAASGLSTDATGLYVADAIAGAGLSIASKVLAVNAGAGIAIVSDAVAVSLATNSGLNTTSGLAVDASIAGAGLALAAGVLSVNVTSGLALSGDNVILDSAAAGTGLAYAAGVLSVNVASGLTTSGDNVILATSAAGNALSYTAGVLDVVTGNGLSISADSVIVNQGFSFTWTGSHTWNTGVFTFNTDPQIASNLDFIGATPRLITSASPLTIQPTGDLTLDPSGIVIVPDAQEIKTTNFTDAATGIDGMRFWDRGSNYRQLTIGAMKMDELYARAFVADEVRIDRGEELWSKSYGVVETDFVLPADEATVNVWFENATGIGTGNIFSVGDYVIARVINWSAGIAIVKVWFTVTALVTAGTVDGYRQQWTIKRETGGTTGITIKKGSTLVDMGQIGQGIIYLSALDQDGGPFIEVGEFTSVAGLDTPVFTYHTRMGNLNGTLDYVADEWGFIAGKNIGSGVATFSGLSADATNGLRLFNTELELYTSGIKGLSLNNTYGLLFDFDASPNLTLSWVPNVDSFTGNEMVRMFGQQNYPATNDIYFQLGANSNAGSSEILIYAYSALDSVTSSLNLRTDRIHLSTGSAHLQMDHGGKMLMGADGNLATTIDSLLHLYENTSAADGSVGLTIEQDGTGDAALRWYLTGGQYYSMGIDNSDSDTLVLSASSALGTSNIAKFSSTGIDLMESAFLRMRDADIAHGMTGYAPTDVYGFLAQGNATGGGLFIGGITDADAVNPVIITAGFGITDPSDALAAFFLQAYKKNGTGRQAIASTEMVYALYNFGTVMQEVLGSGLSRFYGSLELREPAAGITFRDADVAHGMTDVVATDVYGLAQIQNGASGGLLLWGLSDNASVTGINILGTIGVTDPTDTTPAILLQANKKSGTTYGALAAAETVFVIDNYTSRLIRLLGDGSFETVRPGIATAGDFSIDTTGKLVNIGRLSATGGDSTRLIVRNRVGGKLADFDNNSSRVIFAEDATNFVGIGNIATLDMRLHILGSNDGTGGIKFESSAGTFADRFAIYPEGNGTTTMKLLCAGTLQFLDSAGASKMTISEGFGVGIGVGGGSQTGVLSIQAGSVTNQHANVGGVLHVNNTAAGNVGTGLDIIREFIVPASSLVTNNQSVWFEIRYKTAGTSATKGFQVYFGGTAITAEWTSPYVSITEHVIVKGRVFRTGSATAKYHVFMSGYDWMRSEGGTLTPTWSSAQTLSARGRGTADNDVTVESIIVGWDDQHA